jgi:enoyl-CoA hydratase/carnithine racemase
MNIKKPIIAAVNGPVAGMGFGFVLTCDMRFSNRDAKWCGSFSKRGLVAEWGTSFLLPRLVGTGNGASMRVIVVVATVVVAIVVVAIVVVAIVVRCHRTCCE